MSGTTIFKVIGVWPFPTDMLRHSEAEAATPQDAAAIKELSEDFAPSRDSLRKPVTITLTTERGAFHVVMAAKRWESFGWQVLEISGRPTGLTRPEVKPPIKSGWRGNLSGVVENTDSTIKVSRITLELDHATAWALASLLSEASLRRNHALDNTQLPGLVNLGAALGRLIDNPSANNGGREVVK